MSVPTIVVTNKERAVALLEGLLNLAHSKGLELRRNLPLNQRMSDEYVNGAVKFYCSALDDLNIPVLAQNEVLNFLNCAGESMPGKYEQTIWESMFQRSFKNICSDIFDEWVPMPLAA